MADDDKSPITFIVPGQAVAGGVGGAGLRGATGDGAARWLPGRVKSSVRVAALRSAGTPQRLTAVPGEDVVALHIANGPVLLLHPANARDLMLAMADPQLATRAAASGGGEIEVGAQLRWRGLEQASPLTRGLGDVLLSAFEIITGLGKDKIVDIASSQIVQRVDAQVEAGLYLLRAQKLEKLKGSGERVAAVEPKVAAQGPLLVFIHGTFSETAGTFGKLWKLHPGRVRQLFDHYGGRVFAFDHETLGKSPLANALDLVRTLPKGARLHLVTHSRGGLVGEALAVLAHQRSASPAEREFFAAKEYAGQRAELLALAGEMAARQIVVERVVRVACPARGTLLAAKRLDAYLSVLKWAIEATGVPLVGDFVDLLAEVARRRARPDEIPGLAAMIPETPFVNWLNSARAPVAGELLVVSGDLAGDSIGGWIKTLLADAYYWTDSDLVVQTRSMYAGAPRLGGARFLLDHGGKTTHFAYFANPRTADAVVQALVHPSPPQGALALQTQQSAQGPEGFQPIGPLSWAGKDSGGLRGSERDPGKPAVFVLPGILGSNLKHDGERIWLSLRLVGGLDRLAYRPQGADGVLPDGAISLVYDRLAEHLGATHEVIEFAFDWRRPMQDEARRLAKAVDAAIEARRTSGQPVRLLAHSMGGLVARTMQLVAKPTWDRLMAHPGARLVMLGTPNGGSFAPMQILSGDDTFGNTLIAFGSPLQDARARQTIASMPGLLQLQAGLLDPDLKLDREETWQRLADEDFERTQQNNWWHRHAGEAMEAAYRWGVPPQHVLDQAVELRRALDAQRDTELSRCAGKIALVLGRARATPVGFELAPREGLVYLDAADGDGRAPRASALLPGVRAWQIGCEHGSLPSDGGAFEAYGELLEKGSTDKLEALPVTRGHEPAPAPADLRRSRPAREHDAVRPAETPASVFRRDSAFVSAAVPATGGAALAVDVLNGNLSFVAEPLLIGHYVSTELTGTERVVDRLIGGTMSAALRAGLYPEAVGEQQAFVNTRPDPLNPWRPPRPRSVVVVGLGDEGRLREADLQRSVRQSAIGWAQRVAEDPARPAVTLELAATLMGSGGTGISPAASARAIARAVREANLALAEIGWPIVSRLTLVELYLDRATEAWQGLQVLATANPQHFRVESAIRSGTGPLRQQLAAGYRGVDYEMVSITTRDSDGTLEFVLDSRRARGEVRAQQTQVALVRDLVKRAATARNDDPKIGRTLFQLLVPHEIEPFLGGTDSMRLDLDDGAAALPWELLDATDSEAGRAPWSVRSRLLRRLRSEHFRPTPRDASVRDGALVIGEPKLDPGSPYPPLPAARAEARVVRDTLLAGGLSQSKMVDLISDEERQPDARAVIGGLFERAWRIVHICGHGEMPDAQRHGGGVVLSDGLFLGADEMRSLRVVPELVFLNCCHLAAFRSEEVLRRLPDPGAFASRIAGALIEMGVRCVVACGWAVEDGPAAEFAQTFYRELMRGAPFVDAAACARQACWLMNPSGKTWAAYQCYGDPNWVFRHDGADVPRPRATAEEDAVIASPVALALALETLIVRSRFMGADAQAQQAELRVLEGRFAERWGAIGAVAEAFGIAWEAAEDRAAAITWLQRAVQASDATASMKAEETLQNLRARHASRLAGQPIAGAREQVGEALAQLKSLAERHPTVERYSLLGSTHKRRALIERDAGDAPAMRAALQQSFEAYRAAEALAQASEPAELFYPALNRMALELVSHADDAEWPGFDAEASAAALASAEARAKAAPDFWSQVSLIEFDLYQALAERQLATRREALARAYGQLHDRVKAASYWSSVVDQARLVLPTFVDRGSAADRLAARALWQQLEGYVATAQSRSDAAAGTGRARAGPAIEGVPPEDELRVVVWSAHADAALVAPVVEAVRAEGAVVWTPGARARADKLAAELEQSRLWLVVIGHAFARDKEAWRHLVEIMHAQRRGPEALHLLVAAGAEVPEALRLNATRHPLRKAIRPLVARLVGATRKALPAGGAGRAA